MENTSPLSPSVGLDLGMPCFVLVLILVFALVGCSQYIKSTLYLESSVVYLTEPVTTPVGLRLVITLGTVTKTRHTFTGTATLGAEQYPVEGYEVANMNFEFLTPQALPPMSDMVMALKDSSGAVVYSLCSLVGYSDDVAAFNGAALYTGECSSGSTV